MKRHVLARFAAHGKAMNRPILSMAVAYGSPSGIRIAMSARAGAMAWSEALYPDRNYAHDPAYAKKTDETLTGEVVIKARKPKAGANEAELIDAALDAGIELGLQTLPANARKGVDVAAARRVARQRLLRGSFRANLNALEEAQRGLAVLVNASRDPALTILKDAERIAGSFGINARQAQTLVKETKALVEAGKRTDAIKRAMAKRLRQALEARAEFLADALGREAINVSQQALYETAKKQGLLDEERQLREWVTRRDDRVCPICDGIDGQRAPIDEPFESDYDGGEYFAPPAHPRCRCAVRLVTVKSPQRGKRAA
jgi:SPP1 gp7 family putative phage head morphogenesis protein